MVMNLPANVGDTRDIGSIPGREDNLEEEGNGILLQYSSLENSIGREAWWAIVHRATELDVTERLNKKYIQKKPLHIPKTCEST